MEKVRIFKSRSAVRKLKRTIKYSLLTFGLLVGLYFLLRIKFGYFTPYNSWTAAKDVSTGCFQIIRLGYSSVSISKLDGKRNETVLNSIIMVVSCRPS